MKGKSMFPFPRWVVYFATGFLFPFSILVALTIITCSVPMFPDFVYMWGWGAFVCVISVVASLIGLYNDTN
jgi:hypothetical protein